MLNRTLLLPIVCALLLAGCALMQAATPPAPKTVRQATLLATYEVAAVVDAAADSYKQGLIDRTVFQAVVDQAETAKVSIKLAKDALAAGDLSTAQGQLGAVQVVLGSVRVMLGGGK